MGGKRFADAFVGVSESKEGLRKLISVVHGYCDKWRLKANVCKSAVMVLTRSCKGEWKWGEHLATATSLAWLRLVYPLFHVLYMV